MQNNRSIFSFAEGQFQGIRQATALLRIDHQPIHHQIHRKRVSSPRFDVRVVKRLDFPPNAQALEPFLPQAWQLVSDDRWLRLHIRGQNHDARSLGKLQRAIHGAIQSLPANQSPILRAALLSLQCPKQSRVVRDLRYRRHCTAGRRAARPLLDGQYGRQSMNEVHIRPLELFHRLPRLSRQAFHVLAVAFRIQSVECQRRLSRTGYACNHYELIPRNPQLDVLQIVLAGALDMNVPGLSQTHPFSRAPTPKGQPS